MRAWLAILRVLESKVIAAHLASMSFRRSETLAKTREIMYNELRRDVAEWMDAKEDLVRRPAIELTQEGGEFAARAMMSGINAKDIEVMVTPERLLIKGNRLSFHDR